MLTALIFILGLIGAGLCAFGAWLVFPPAGFIVAGVLLLATSFMYARAQAYAQFIRTHTDKAED
ncbi:hypothetical protein [Marinobacterium sp. BA1]|uniref:hypothetical protein n=1 Tax=Marinobacterium sp. BA1 TaxID=3138931 RepID=UPI0032E7EAF7